MAIQVGQELRAASGAVYVVTLVNEEGQRNNPNPFIEAEIPDGSDAIGGYLHAVMRIL